MPRKPRSYDASGRRQRAAEGRERMLDVARRLFGERGYVETTIEAIAAEAKVSTPTVYATFQSKRGLLTALTARLVSGEPGAPPLLQTAGPRAVMAESDPRSMLARFVAEISKVQDRIIPTWEVLKNAARSEPDIADLVERMQARRYSNLASIPNRLVELDALRPDLTVDDATRTTWVLTSPEVRQMLITSAGWSVDQYQAWLLDTLSVHLLSPAATPE